MSERHESFVMIAVLSFILGVLTFATYNHIVRSTRALPAEESAVPSKHTHIGPITLYAVNGLITEPKMEVSPPLHPPPEVQPTEKTIERLSAYIAQINPKMGSMARDELSRHILEVAHAEKVDLPLFVALIKTESAFESGVTSSANAQGLTQVIPRWHEATMDKVRVRLGMSSETTLYHPRFNLHMGASVLKQFVRLHGGDVTKGLLGYNGSLNDPDKKYANKVLTTAESVQRLLNS